MTNVLRMAIKELEQLSEAEQEHWGTFILGFFGLRQGAEKEQSKQGEPYSSLEVLRNAHLDLPADYSVTYERSLYGREDDIDA